MYSHLTGLRFVALRLFTIYGPSQRPDLAIHRFVKAITLDEPITVYGDGSSSRDYTYVEDAVKSIISAIGYDQTLFEIINIGNHVPVSLNELVSTIEEVTGKKAKIQQLPDQAGEVPTTFADISKANRMLQYKPSITLKEGIANFYDWFQKNREVLIHQ